MTAPPSLDAALYEIAEKMLAHNRPKLVIGGNVTPQWIDRGSRFWYRLETADGHAFVLVDPAERTRDPAFDHAQLAKALEAASGESVTADELPFASSELSDGAVEFDAFGAHWRCLLDSYQCQQVEGHEQPSFLDVLSPDKQWAVVRREHNLSVRRVDTGVETPLTTDGVADQAYGSQPDCLTFGMLMRAFGAPGLPPIVAWSPDSRRIVTHRIDQRGVLLSHLVEAAPKGGGRPELHTYRYAMPGDEVMPRAELIVFDVATGTSTPAKAAPLFAPMFSPILSKQVVWSTDSSAVYYLEQPRDLKTLRLNRMDPLTGEVTLLVEERGDPRVEPGQFMGQTILKVLASGEEVLWYSQRDGWGHLYLYDTASGELRNQVTSGEWAVQQILHVDEAARVVYFLAAGLVAADPYRRQVCRVGLDGSGFARLGDDDLDHAVTLSENEAYFVDSASTVDTPPVIRVRDWSGDVLVELERADISRLLETGWTRPAPFTAKAADGVTDIYGVMYLPNGFDPTKRYPVVDSPYPGPQHNRVQPCFGGTGHFDMDAEAVAALGFAVIAVDGRGTPGRSRAFHDYSYGNYGDAGSIADHVAAIRQLATTRPWMDLERVGVYGYSGGGYATVRAMCAFPDFYQVGVSLCGNHDQRYYHLAWGETYDGPLDEETYARSSNPEIAHRLEGKLLLIHGEMDDNVHPHQTMLLVDRLIAANKDFELLIVPGAEHLFMGYHAYVIRRRWDFLVRHLLGVEPPAGYRLAELPVDPSVLSALG